MGWEADFKTFLESPSSYIVKEVAKASGDPSAGDVYTGAIAGIRQTAHGAFESYLGMPGLDCAEQAMSAAALGTPIDPHCQEPAAQAQIAQHNAAVERERRDSTMKTAALAVGAFALVLLLKR